MVAGAVGPTARAPGRSAVSRGRRGLMGGMTEKTSLLIGAYERDNFGDLLFLRLTEDLLPGPTAASLIAADMRELTGRYVVPYETELARRSFDLVWVVGGEVGATTTELALGFSMPEAEREAWSAADPAGRDRLRRLLGAPDLDSSAYVPDLGAYPLASGTPLVLNSVGVAGLRGTEPQRRDALLARVAAADAVVVRDRDSQAFLDESGVRSRLAPDLVQTIVDRPDVPTVETWAGTLVVQASVRHLAKVGATAFWLSVAEAARRTGLGVTLFAAGTAHLHDSYDSYDEARRLLAEAAPDVDVQVVPDRDPLVLCGVVRSAAAWLGSSLHGRVVASAFGVPRVSLENAKVSAYAATWDAGMPFGATVPDVPAAVEAALGLRGDDDGTGRRLADQARESTGALVAAHA